MVSASEAASPATAACADSVGRRRSTAQARAAAAWLTDPRSIGRPSRRTLAPDREPRCGYAVLKVALGPHRGRGLSEPEEGDVAPLRRALLVLVAVGAARHDAVVARRQRPRREAERP